MRKTNIVLFCEKTGLSVQAASCLESSYRAVLSDEGALAIWKSQIARVRPDRKFDHLAVLDRIGSLEELCGVPKNTLHLLFLIALLPGLRARYEKERIPSEYLHAYAMNLAYIAEKSLEKTGMCGTDIAWWFMDYYRLKLFTIGRLQFRKRRLRRDFETEKLHFRTGDEYLDVHIPSDGPLSESGCRDAYRRAARFFRDRYGMERIVFGCHSWLLSPVLRDMLPPSSNILTFANEYELVFSEVQKGNPWTVFLFGSVDPD
ncbi:MAG: hypothetical protein II719_07640, partial [Clostridia bacterium]|nr:hypothetical protein [Clostridia bacterium]